MVLQKNENIVIVGAGVFGVSAAYHFLERGYQDVTILDRSQILPAPDAASNDINRVVRCSYDDKFYTDFALQAISSWKDQKRWGDTYHETGVIVLGLSSSSYADEAYKNDVAAGASVEVLKDSDSIRKMLPSNIPLGPLDGFSGYLNRDGGWANAGQGVSKLIEKVKELNGKFIPGKDVSGLLQVEGKTTGVQCSDGTTIGAALTIIATGSWTPSSFSDLGLGRMCLATGQTIAMIQLSESEAERYKDCPVLLDFGSGFYIFPVGATQRKRHSKMAMHTPGYTHFVEGNRTISTPRTITSNPSDGLLVPKPALKALRTELSKLYPELAEKPFTGTRLCWYNDTPDENWVIGYYPRDKGLIIATGGSGHAYKFLPVLGRIVADLVEDKLEAELIKKFAVDREIKKVDVWRLGQLIPLNVEDLCRPEDLQP